MFLSTVILWLPACLAGAVETTTSESCGVGDGSTQLQSDQTISMTLLQQRGVLSKAMVQPQEEVEEDDSGTPFATVPLKFVVITRDDGTGNFSKAALEKRVAALNKHYNGDDPRAVSEGQARALNKVKSGPDTCGKKCDVALCYEDGRYKNIVDLSECWCEDNYCKKWSALGKLHGARANAQFDFTLTDVKYVTHNVWHDQCCCAYAAGLNYEPKQLEIMDKLIDKATVRKEVTIIICDMKSTMGMALISGSMGCNGGPGIMLTHTFEDHTLAHEFGHFFGLYHTFNEECHLGGVPGCKKEEVCDDTKNVGDRIGDTPVHKKPEVCAGSWDAETCPGGGLDPLDNVMSYSGCQLSRFTLGQVAKMRQTVTDYYPAFLATGGGAAKDLPCNPEFPSFKDKLPPGYSGKPKTTPAPAAPGQPAAPSCPGLEKGQCDTHDKKGCYCHDAKICCKDHGCGGMPGQRQCLPCKWKAWGTDFTTDSCNDQK